MPSIYHEYKSHGTLKIRTADIGCIVRLPIAGEKSNLMGSYVIEEYEENKIDISDRHTLDNTISLLSIYDSFVLVNKTHEHAIWKDDSEKLLTKFKVFLMVIMK